jgi:hypothetical protein
MTGKIDSTGTCRLTYNPANGDPLLSPDCSQQLLPCDRCGAPKWVLKNVAAFVCTVCVEAEDKGIEEEPMPEAVSGKLVPEPADRVGAGLVLDGLVYRF